MALPQEPLSKLEPTPELAALKAKRWPAEGKEERIAKALAAWNSPPFLPDMPASFWKHIAEDVDMLDE